MGLEVDWVLIVFIVFFIMICLLDIKLIYVVVVFDYKGLIFCYELYLVYKSGRVLILDIVC